MDYGEKEKPSIIQQIVIYNKPNIKRDSINDSLLTVKGDIIINNWDGKLSKKIEGISTKQEVEDNLFLFEDLEAKEEQEDVPDEEIEDAPLVFEPEPQAAQPENHEDKSVSPPEPPQLANTVFKKPRGRPKKNSVTPKNVNTLDKYLIKSPSSTGTPQKRPRGRPRKIENQVKSQEKFEGTPKKRGRKRKLETTLTGETLNNTSEKDKVEEALQNMFNEPQSGGDDDDDDEDYEDSDEDSRQEWIPEEYVEYKQQHLMKMNKKKKFPCKTCKLEFDTYYAMRKHRALEHDDAGKPRKQASMEESVDTSSDVEAGTDSESLAEWMPDDYAEYKLKHSHDKMKRSQWFKCKICCAVFSSYYHMSKHKAEHEAKPTPYECNQCPESFKDIEELMVHIRIHQGKDPYQCRKCEKGFSTKEELDEHLTVHILKKKPMVKKFKCNVCSKEFAKLCDVERHTRVHTGEKPWSCKICRKSFQQAHNLSKHLLIHLHVKPFLCEICNKKFGRIDVLNRHLLTHSMEKPFKCKLCQKSFIRELQLINHMNKTHNIESVDEPEEMEFS